MGRKNESLGLSMCSTWAQNLETKDVFWCELAPEPVAMLEGPCFVDSWLSGHSYVLLHSYKNSGKKSEYKVILLSFFKSLDELDRRLVG